MNKRSMPILIAVLFLTASVFGQRAPTITFAEKEYNFGTFRESDGIITHDFQFTNQGKIPLILNDVKASCGCTVPEWSREPVLPGKTGFVKVSFDPLKQSGSFNKTIQVNSNADVPLVIIAVKGVVIPVDKVEDVYKFTIGEIRLQTIYAAFGEIYKGKTATYSIKIYNGSYNKPASLSFPKVPAHLRIRVIPEIIEPQQEGRIEFEYITDGFDSWDYAVDRIDFLINQQVFPNNRINVTANIKEDFSGMSAEEMALAPHAEFDSPLYDFGVIPDDKTVEHTFKITNTGKSALYIRKITASCGCTAVQPAKVMIPPGDSTEIKVVFNPAGKDGNQKKAVTIITNDPKRSRSLLWINAVIQKSVSNINQQP
jgi:hypothetical protein